MSHPNPPEIAERLPSRHWRNGCVGFSSARRQAWFFCFWPPWTVFAEVSWRIGRESSPSGGCVRLLFQWHG